MVSALLYWIIPFLSSKLPPLSWNCFVKLFRKTVPDRFHCVTCICWIEFHVKVESSSTFDEIISQCKFEKFYENDHVTHVEIVSENCLILFHETVSQDVLPYNRVFIHLQAQHPHCVCRTQWKLRIIHRRAEIWNLSSSVQFALPVT